MRPALATVSWPVANARTATVSVCVPAFPPIDAQIGISTASATTLAMASSKRPITAEARREVPRFTSSQIERCRAVSSVELVDHFLGLRGEDVPAGLVRHGQGLGPQWAAVQHADSRLQQAGAEIIMGDQQQTDTHDSSRWRIMALRPWEEKWRRS